jgi:periplasmic glucans biosynthesis protein
MAAHIQSLAWLAAVLGAATLSLAQNDSPEPLPRSGLFERLLADARASGGQKFEPPENALPDFLRNLSYDDYMRIRFKTERSLWRNSESRFQVQFFHPGYLFQDPVRIHVVDSTTEREIGYSQEMFDLGGIPFPRPLPRSLCFAGLRVLYPLNQPDKMDEVVVFLGTSFFRLLAADQRFGSSARGLAIDTAEPGGEEFPRFSAFWIERPGPLAEQIQLFARLESRRVAGAYRFLVKPGPITVMEVEGHLFFRDDIKKLGLAPLTGMFFFGENRTRHFADFRPEVHDADGLLLENADRTWVWRPLMNPAKVHQVSPFQGATGFGLLQRDRNWDHYQDLEARFESRPSYWVTPVGDWTAGRVELVEIPSTEERNDNVVAYWVPPDPVRAGQGLRFHYQLHAFSTDPDRPASDLARVRDTRLQAEKGRPVRFVIDFAGGSPRPDSPPVTCAIESSAGQLQNLTTQPNPMLGGWRAFFDLVPEGDKPVELRGRLLQGEKAISETWVYHFIRPW